MPQATKADFLDALRASLAERDFVKLSLGKPKKGQALKKVIIAPVIIKGAEQLQFCYRDSRQDKFKNFSQDAARAELEALLGAEFFAATLFTLKSDLAFEIFERHGQLRVQKPTHKQLPELSHNRKKEHLIEPSAPYLHSLGISSAAGEVRGARYDKFKQINKFIEVVSGLVERAGFKAGSQIDIVDFGSGKSYLTFALYDYLTSQKRLKAKLTGLELRADLVEQCERLARRLNFTGLSFRAGSIADAKVAQTDLVVALHACDTATDDAILQALSAKVKILVLAPCCQKFLRARLKLPELLKPIFKHGILEEHLAVSLTDGLRALVLEAFGYSTQVFEFISAEHTARNTMITAVWGGGKFQEKKWEQLEELKERFGVRDFYLDGLARELWSRKIS